MGVLKEISERVEPNLESVRKRMYKASINLESQEKLLYAIQESVSESSKGLDLVREALKEWLKRVEEKEDQAFDLFQEEGIRNFKLEKEEWSLIKDDVEVIQEKLNEEVKLIEGVFEKMKLEMKQFQTTGKVIDDRFTEISFKERQSNLIKVQIDSRMAKLDKREEHLERHEKEIALREALLVSKQEELKAKENVLDAREKILDLQKELDSVKKSKGQSCSKHYSISSSASGERSRKSRKRSGNSAFISKEISEAEQDSPSKRNCHVERSSNSPDIGGNSAHPDLGLAHSNSGDPLGSNEIDENQVNPQGSNGGPVNDAEQDYELSKSHSPSRDDSVSNPIDYSSTLINDFEKQRSKGCFKCGQIWACYNYDDPKCSMPRLYVRIVEVLGISECDFRLGTIFLQPTPYADAQELQKHEGWKEWIDAGLPVGCGNFKQANPTARYLHDFSHQMFCKDICSPFLIYPTKGEIWALYKDWNIITWISTPENYRNCKYEIVEVLDNDTSSGSIRVGYLDKIVGFVSLFQRRSQNENDSFVINTSEMLRFSHKVPSVKMTSNKIQGVPEGSFELDYKSLPANL